MRPTTHPMLGMHLSSPSGPSRVAVRFGLVAMLFMLASACASGPPSVTDPAIAQKLDLRLRTALSKTGWSEDLGDYIRVVVRMTRKETPDDRLALEAIGRVGSYLGSIVTMTLAPGRVVDLAALSKVEFVELEMPNVPMPPPPPGEVSEQ